MGNGMALGYSGEYLIGCGCVHVFLFGKGLCWINDSDEWQ